MTTTERKVIVLEETKHEVDSMSVYGAVTYLFDRVSHSRGSIWSPVYRRDVLAALRRVGYQPERDYFLCAGHNVALILALSEMQREFGEVRVLLFCATERTYIPSTLGEPADARRGEGNVSTGKDSARRSA